MLARSSSSLMTISKNAFSPLSTFILRNNEILALYAQVQQTTSKLVTKLAAQHARLPFPQAAFPLALEGDGYNLHCTLKPWPYGKTLELKWGDIWLTPSEEKWQVLFETTD